MPDRNAHASLMLRRFLCPYNAAETLAEVVDLAPQFRIDEIMWVPVSQVPRLGLEPLDRLRTTIPCLHEAREALSGIGVTHSINVFFTLGHGEYGVDTAALIPGLEFMVGPDGARAQMTACPLSPGWREWVCETYAMLASTRPVRLWIDDDFRLCGHHIVEWGCYCDRHLAAFSMLVGEPVAREALLAAVLQPGQPHPWRALWLDFQAQCLYDISRLLTETVREVSPETEMAWMSTNADVMAIEGRNPARQMEALVRPDDPERRAAIRITMAGYAEGNLRQFLGQDLALKKILPLLSPGVLRCTEVEGCPNSAYAKSARWYEAEMIWAAVVGAPHQTLNVYDYYGGAMSDSPEIGPMLARTRPLLEAIAAAVAGSRHRGVRLFHPPASPREVYTTAGREMWELGLSATGWSHPLRALGLPVCCEGDQEVAAVTGQLFRCLSPEEIEALLRRGVLLDMSALRVLQELGLWHLAGVRLAEEITVGTRLYGVEELIDQEFGGAGHTYTWWKSFGTPTLGRLEPADGARVVSELRGPDPGLVLPGVTLFENELGGRVAVTPQDYSGAMPGPRGPSLYYYLPRRLRLMRPVLRWLAHDRLPLEVEAPGWTLPHRADREGHVFAGVMNVNLDPWQGMTLRLTVDEPVRAVRQLDRRGEWRPLPEDAWSQETERVMVEIRETIEPLGVVCVDVEYGG